MKNSLFFLTLILFLMQACSKDELATRTSGATDNQQNVVLSSVRPIGFSLTAPLITLSDYDIQYANFHSPAMVLPRTENHHVNGHVHPILDPNEVDFIFSGVQNNGGIHGNAQVKSWFLDFNMATECITVVGNEAIYGGVITQVNYVDPGWAAVWCGEICIEEGVHFVCKVVDNGEGQNAPPDQSALYFAIGTVPLCDLFPVDHPYWAWQMQDVQGQGDQVQVQ